MKATYYLEIECQCPSNPDVLDQYDCTIRSYFMIPVEHIKEAVKELTAEPRFQEDLTAALCKKLTAAYVQLKGEHQGVWVESEVSMEISRSESGAY